LLISSKALCESLLEGNVDTDNCISLLLLADTYRSSRLMDRTLAVIHQNLDKLKQCNEFAELPQILQNKILPKIKEEDTKEKLHILETTDVPYKRLVNSKELSQAIRAARNASKLPVHKLAKNINEKESLITLYETPGAVVPQQNVLRKLERELGCKLMHLVATDLCYN